MRWWYLLLNDEVEVDDSLVETLELELCFGHGELNIVIVARNRSVRIDFRLEQLQLVLRLIDLLAEISVLELRLERGFSRSFQLTLERLGLEIEGVDGGLIVLDRVLQSLRLG